MLGAIVTIPCILWYVVHTRVCAKCNFAKGVFMLTSWRLIPLNCNATARQAWTD